MNEEERNPTIIDYMAGSILANGFIWIWRIVLPFLSQIPPETLGRITYVIFLMGGTTSSYLICKRATTNHYFVGFKSSALAWIISLFFLSPSATGNVLGLFVIIFLIFAVGGVAGAYLARRSKPKPQALTS